MSDGGASALGPTFEAAFRASTLPSALWPDADGQRRIARYLEQRAAWGAVHNLSGPAALEGQDWADVLDSLALCGLSAEGEALVDVGTGSGVPGLLVACLRPAQPILLVEPSVKRVAFLRSFSHAQGLDAVRVERARWPITEAALRAFCDDAPYGVLSRAVVSPEAWPKLATAARPPPRVLYRFLAKERPAHDLAQYTLCTAQDYRVGESARRIERLELR